MFNNGVEFDKIFQKDYFEDALRTPDMSNKSMNQLLQAVNSLKLVANEDPSSKKQSQMKKIDPKSDISPSKNLKKDISPKSKKSGFSKYLNVNQTSENSSKKDKQKGGYRQQAQEIFQNTYLQPNANNHQQPLKSPKTLDDNPTQSSSSSKLREKSVSPTYASRQSRNNQPQIKNGSRTPSPSYHSKTSSDISSIQKKYQNNDISLLTQNQDLNQDVINRLFTNSKKAQELKDKKKSLLIQKELDTLQEKPQISDRSHKIVMNNVRQHMPIYSPERYTQEVQSLKTRQEQAAQLKQLLNEQKDLQEEEMMLKFSASIMGKKINPDEFKLKYDQKMKQWEARKIQTLESYQPGIGERSKSPSFKPEINKKSKIIAQDIERLDKRIQVLQDGKKRKIAKLTTMLQPTFTPQINKNTDKLLNESKINPRGPSPIQSYVNRDQSFKRNYQRVITRSTSPVSQINRQISSKNLKQSSKPSQNQASSSLISQKQSVSTVQSMDQNPFQLANSILQSPIKQEDTMIKQKGEQLVLLKEYMKLKEQINVSLSSRPSNNNNGNSDQKNKIFQTKNLSQETQIINEQTQNETSQSIKKGIEPYKNHLTNSYQSLEVQQILEQSRLIQFQQHQQVGDYSQDLNLQKNIQTHKSNNSNLIQSPDHQFSTYNIAADQSISSWSSPLKNQAINRQLQNKTFAQVNQKEKLHKFEYTEPKNQKDHSPRQDQTESVLNNIRDSIELLNNRIQQTADSPDRVKGSKDLQKEIQKLKSLKSHLIHKKFQSVSPSRSVKSNTLLTDSHLKNSNQHVMSRRNLKHDTAQKNMILSKSQDSLFKLQQCEPIYQSKHKFQNKREDENVQDLTRSQERRNLAKDISSHKPFGKLQDINQLPSLDSPDKSRLGFNSNTLNSNYKIKIDYQFQSENSPDKIIEENSFNNTLTFRDKSQGKVNDTSSELTFNQIQKYLDSDTKTALRLTSSQRKQKNLYDSKQYFDTVQSRQVDIIKKLVQKNSHFGRNDSILSVPKELLNEIEESGLDSITILKSVINQFDHLFGQKENSKKSTQKNMKANNSIHQNASSKQRKFEEANMFTLNNK
ncbi:UNKNOWN [Stylonychia lemnae]|uniref:Uncharacterized protein n=1 Tax=Stylonychia lemnae TaxID=5949 RepID=A0A077ZTN5_STYLE|nr:UNKNOWN [Stylonychia lemnae]|eukprot:CDW72700.1 UNKNOWN [Stylonychia lemnae]